MGCGCESKTNPEVESMAFQIFSDAGEKVDNIGLSDPASWHCIVTTLGLYSKLGETITRCGVIAIHPDFKERIKFTVVDTSSDSSGRLLALAAGLDYLNFPGKSYPNAINVAAGAQRGSQYTLVIHDDVLLPSPLDPVIDTDSIDVEVAVTAYDWLNRLELGLAVRDAGMTVPMINGYCTSMAQDHCGCKVPPRSTPFHTTEYTCGAAFALRTLDLIYFGIEEGMAEGYDWFHIDLQKKLADAGRVTTVSSVIFDHQGNGTIKEVMAKVIGIEIDPHIQIGFINTLFRRNMQVFAHRRNVKVDFKTRPRLPRILPKLPDGRKSFAAIVSTTGGIESALQRLNLNLDQFGEIVFLDASAMTGTQEIAEACMASVDSMSGGCKVRYVPHYTRHEPTEQAVDHCASRHVVIIDYRPGADASPLEGVAIRVGNGWRLPQQISEYHIGMYQHYALGDTLQMTPAIHAFKQRWPHIKIYVHHVWAAKELLRHNPDIAHVSKSPMHEKVPPAQAVDIGAANGGEEVIFAPFDELGLPQPADGTVRIRYYIKPREHWAALEWLSRRGIDLDNPTEKLYGVQKHGGWEVKFWRRHDDCVRALRATGAKVLVFGSDKRTEKDSDATIYDDPGVILVKSVRLRLLAAIISVLDGVVCHDSGIGYMSCGVGTPVVSIWGHNKPARMMGSCGPNIVCLQKRTPEMCEIERGTSCRKMFGGKYCPFREDHIGGDCMDEITVEEVTSELFKMPHWDQPVRNRAVVASPIGVDLP